MDQPLYLSAPLALSAVEGDDLPRQFSGVAYSGGLVTDWEIPIVIDLSATHVEAGLPLLHMHDQSSDIGTVSAVTNDGSALSVSGVLFSDLDGPAKTLAQKSRRGARYQMSVGLYGARAQAIESGGVQVNGRSLNAPLTILRGGTIREVSIVPLGADRNTSAAFFTATNEATMPTETTPLPDPRIVELSAQIDSYRADLSAANARAEAAEKALSERLKQERESDIHAAFSAIGRDPPQADSLAVYAALPAEAWKAIRADLTSRPKPPEHLFKEQAVGDPVGERLDLAAIHASLLAQVSGKKG